ncbi:hypothetical protein KJ742_04540 [Patescibacteria group bacterium]|nr:hypothetical protein [Patescibacteria group bacterium]MBU1683187.1 hypothetical protein [Patescibacteria group bacterium]MBU1934730.1 hypothetical protein [Patescibacteria group bacterium]
MKKVVYIEIDEEITSIYDRIKRVKQKEIYLVVPRKAVLFQSVVNLKILSKKLKELKKKLIIITTDRMGRHLAEQIGLPVYSQIEVEEIKAPEEESPKMRIEPIQARRNEVLRDLPRRFTEKKITIGELIKEYRAQSKKNKKDSKGLGDSMAAFNFVRPNRKFLALILLVSIGLFMLISYIALPGATIYIRPKFDNISHTVNITLADKRQNQNLLAQNEPHVIASEEVVTVTKQTKVFNTTSKIFEGTNATGEITIINTALEDWTLKNETRFQTEEGVIFRIQESVVVPSAIYDEEEEIEIPGELTVSVEADSFDIYDDPVGDRGNIDPSIFYLPGLSDYNQKLIWGESYSPMTGGVTAFQKVVLEEDIEAATKQIEDNLILMAKEDLRNYIEEMNNLNHTNFVLLDDRRYLKTELLDLRISDDLEGSYKDKFEVFAKIQAEGVAYDFDQLFALLKKELKTRTHPDMRIRDESINPDTISYEVIDEDEDLGQIKITATIQGIEEYVIEESLEAGLRFSTKVKEKVAGLSLEEAENYINNLTEVDAVQIKTWPVWLSTMPKIPDNIEIELMEEQ